MPQYNKTTFLATHTIRIVITMVRLVMLFIDLAAPVVSLGKTTRKRKKNLAVNTKAAFEETIENIQ